MIFTFGSNLAGIHGRGAAKTARLYYGAVQGIGTGLQGNSFAIPTKDHSINTLPLNIIEGYVERFLEYARMYPDKAFQITCIGCGLAGYSNEEIAPMFGEAPKNNCFFDLDWRPVFQQLGKEFEYWGTFTQFMR